MTTPSKKLGGRPKRVRVLAEAAFRMRQGGKSLRQVQAWLNSQGVRACYRGDPERPHFLVGRRWADRGAETLAQFRAAEGQERIRLTVRRYLEAQCQLGSDMVRVPPVDDEDWMIPALRQEVDASVVKLIWDTFPREAALRICRGIVVLWESYVAQCENILKRERDAIAALEAALGEAHDPALAALEASHAALVASLDRDRRLGPA